MPEKMQANIELEAAGPASASANIPVMVITPRRGLFDLGFRELWRYRDLLYFLVWRDIKVRYKQTVLGASWAILQPFLLMVVFSIFFGKLAGIKPPAGIPYPIFVYAGLTPWTFFASSVSGSGNSLVSSTNLITKVYFPRLVIPGASVLAFLVDFCLAAAVMGLMMAYYKFVPGLSILLVPALVLLTALLAVGVGLWLSALNVKYRDVRYVIPFFIQVWLFTTPVIYPTAMIPSDYRYLMALNPMTGIINAFRGAFLGQPIEYHPLLISCIITAVVLFLGMLYFRRMERSFADVI